MSNKPTKYKAYEYTGDSLVYSIIEVDEILADKDKEIEELKQKLENVQASMYADVVDANMEVMRLKELMPEYEQFIKDKKFKKEIVEEYDGYVYEWMGHRYIATPYINIFIKGILRALWIARAKRAIEKIAWFKLWNSSISTMNPEDGARQEFDKWKRNLGKFLKKAEEYK